MQNNIFGFVGLGLIGGSVAKAIRKYLPSSRIIACDVNETALQQAQSEGICNETSIHITDAFSSCDIIFLCTPVSCNNAYLTQLKQIKKNDCILTDVGSVKNSIDRTVNELGLTDCFIGGHPMTGSERSGYEASLAGLLENAYYILTPAEAVDNEKIVRLEALITSLKALPLVMDTKKHDQVTSAISHLPHMLAFCLVNLIQGSDDPAGTMKQIAAGGFKDITRIASSSSVMWQQICAENRDELLEMMDAFTALFSQLKEKIASNDQIYLHNFFENAKNYRDSFDEVASGPISRSYYISLFIPDEAGAIATISVLFAKEGISIKNIGIIHNREYEEGALRIEFYDAFSLKSATALLQEKNYHIYNIQ